MAHLLPRGDALCCHCMTQDTVGGCWGRGRPAPRPGRSARGGLSGPATKPCRISSFFRTRQKGARSHQGPLRDPPLSGALALGHGVPEAVCGFPALPLLLLLGTRGPSLSARREGKAEWMSLPNGMRTSASQRHHTAGVRPSRTFFSATVSQEARVDVGEQPQAGTWGRVHSGESPAPRRPLCLRERQCGQGSCPSQPQAPARAD